MNKEDKKVYNDLQKKLLKCKYYEDTTYISLHYLEDQKIKLKSQQSKLHVGLINIPCSGFGDIVNCSIFYQYLKDWYPNMKVSICTPEIDKFKSLKIKGLKFIELKTKKKDKECGNYGDYKFKNKNLCNFDLIGVVPLLLSEGMYGNFILSHLQKLIPHATYYNTFTVSEYNGESPPYTFPIGVGEGYLGLFLTDMEIPKHNLIQSPYLMTYTAGIDYSGVGTHAILCYLSFLEMVTKKYNHYSKLQIIIPTWVSVAIEDNAQFKSKVKRIIEKNFNKILLITDGKEEIVLLNKTGNTFILRGDILPQPRTDFISLIKYSLSDVLLTGDQSITDAFSYCRMNKRIWYETAPWKYEFIQELSKVIPNKYLRNFRTSCGCLKGIQLPLNNSEVIRKYDFRKLGKPRMDAVLLQYHNRDNPIFKSYMESVTHSRLKETASFKFEKAVKQYYQIKNI